jgi:hypothetical protein
MPASPGPCASAPGTPALTQQAIELVADPANFIVARHSKERLSFTWNSSSSSLILKKLLEYKHLEKDQRINPLAPCVPPPLLFIVLIKKRSK